MALTGHSFKQTVMENTLRHCEFFKGLPATDMEQISAFTVTRTLAKGDYLFHEGSKAEGFYIVQNGAVNVHRVGAGLSSDNGATRDTSICNSPSLASPSSNKSILTAKCAETLPPAWVSDASVIANAARPLVPPVINRSAAMARSASRGWTGDRASIWR